MDPNFIGEENYFKYLDLSSLYASAMVRNLAMVEISVCDNQETGFAYMIYEVSSNNKIHIYTTDVKYNEELKQKTKKYPFSLGKTKSYNRQFKDWRNENMRKKINLMKS